MNTRNKLLETCLARLAAGESLETCLADYPNEAGWLRPLLTTVSQVNRLPAQQLRPAADQAIQQQLRQAARQMDQVRQTSVPPLRQRPFHFVEEGMKNISRFLGSWLPRIVVAGAAVALLFIFVTQFTNWLPTLSNPIAEPAAEVATTAVTTHIVGDTTITLEADLSADPGEVPLYSAQMEPVPTTPEDALAWAQNFGLADPEVYRGVNESDPVLYVLGSDDQRLSFQNYPYGPNGISYTTNPAATNTSNDPMPFDAAAAVAITFLRDHNLLPESYIVEPALGNRGSVQQIIIRPQFEGGFIGGDSSGATLRVGVNADSQVIHTSLSQIILEPSGTTTVISAQQAYEDLLNGRNVQDSSTFSTMTAPDEMPRSYQPPAPTWEIGDSVDLFGRLEVIVNAQTGEQRVTLIANQNMYRLIGRSVAELGNKSDLWGSVLFQNVHVQGTISTQNNQNSWQVAVDDWEVASSSPRPCLTGSLTSTGDAAQFRGEDGTDYVLPNAPEEIAEGEQMQICLYTQAEPGNELAWFHILIPPRSEGSPLGGTENAGEVGTSGMSLGGIVQGDVVIERAELIYFYEPQPPFGNESEMEPQLLEPMWAFYGRSTDGREQFIIYVRATTGN